jgi:integrase
MARSENTTRLTHKGIERKRAPASGRREIWDVECPGFGIRITEGGIKAFQVLYRFGGKPRRKGLGRFISGDGCHCLAKARRRARDIIEAARAGTDPELKERAEAAERARAQANTFAAVRTRFINEYAKQRNRHWQEVERYFERDLAEAWDALPIENITKRDIIAAIEAKARESGPYAANRLFAHVRKLFRWAAGKDLVAAVPVVGIEKPGVEKERARVLTATEMKALWSAWEHLGWPFGPMFKLLLVVGQRRDEVAGLRWDELRPLEGRTGATPTCTPIEWTWVIPGERTKSGRPQVVPLPPLASEIIGNLPRFTSPYVFPARGGAGYASGFSRAKARSDDLSGIASWRLHDLRRSVATGMGELGTSPFVVARVLNHAETSVTGRHYNMHDYRSEKRHALEAWARRLETLVRPAPDNVVELRARS